MVCAVGMTSAGWEPGFPSPPEIAIFSYVTSILMIFYGLAYISFENSESTELAKCRCGDYGFKILVHFKSMLSISLIICFLPFTLF